MLGFSPRVEKQATPTRIDIPNAQSISVGENFDLVLTSDNEIYGWGDARLGQRVPERHKTSKLIPQKILFPGHSLFLRCHFDEMRALSFPHFHNCHFAFRAFSSVLSPNFLLLSFFSSYSCCCCCCIGLSGRFSHRPFSQHFTAVYSFYYQNFALTAEGDIFAWSVPLCLSFRLFFFFFFASLISSAFWAFWAFHCFLDLIFLLTFSLCASLRLAVFCFAFCLLVWLFL